MALNPLYILILMTVSVGLCIYLWRVAGTPFSDPKVWVRFLLFVAVLALVLYFLVG